jgi:ketosteroid isomerase-like protein
MRRSKWHEPDVDVPWRGIHRGHDGFVSWLHIIGRELADLVVQPDEFIATNDTVVVLGHESARVTATGRTYHSDFAFVFRVRNGKLTAFRAYHDTDAMMRATAV